MKSGPAGPRLLASMEPDLTRKLTQMWFWLRKTMRDFCCLWNLAVTSTESLCVARRAEDDSIRLVIAVGKARNDRSAPLPANSSLARHVGAVSRDMCSLRLK